MKDTTQEWVGTFLQYILRDAYDRHCDIGRIDWATVLVRNDMDFVTALGKRHHRANKIPLFQALPDPIADDLNL